MYRMGHASPEAALRYQHATRARDAELAAALGDLVKDATPGARRPVRAMNARRESDVARGHSISEVLAVQTRGVFVDGRRHVFSR